MKNYLAIFAFLLCAHLYAEGLRFNVSDVSLDTVPFTFQRYGDWISKHRQVKLWCSAATPTKIVGVYQWPENSYPSNPAFRTQVSTSKFSYWPEVVERGKEYEVSLDVYGPQDKTYQFVTDNGESVIIDVHGREEYLSLREPAYSSAWPSVMEGRPYMAERIIVNSSLKVITVDSIVCIGPGWSTSAPVPFVLEPGESKSIFFGFDGRSVAGNSSHLSSYVFHHAEAEPADMLYVSIYLGLKHGMLITGSKDKNFGRVRNGDVLTWKVPVKNTGTHKFSLQGNKSAYASFTKDSLAPGDTAIATVTWKVEFAKDSFRMEIPLFRYWYEAYCVVVMHGTTNSSIRRERSVNPDSMIWVEGTVIHLDTLYRSQYHLNYDIRLKNNSPSSIVVSRASTGDGGSYAEASREPVPPGQEFTVRFVQDLNTGRQMINRSVHIEIQYLDGSGVVVHKIVTITAPVVDDVKK